MKALVSIKSPPLSINQMYSRDIRYKTKEAFEWFTRVFVEIDLEHNQKQIETIRNTFDPSIHAVALDIKFTYPKDKLLTKAGKISSYSQDLSNCEKSIIDALFDEKFYGKGFTKGCKNLNINDKYIVSMSSKKVAGHEHLIELEVSLLNLADLGF